MFPVYEQKKENVHILQKTSRHAPPHLHNSVEFIYVISGSMEIGMGQELFHMDEGDFAVIFPDVIHHYQVFEKGKNKSIYVWALPVITSNYMDTLQNLCPVDPVIKKADLHPDIKYNRKNWVMIDTIAGAESSAIIYSLAETAKANNLKPYDYFKYLLTEIPKHLDDKNDDFCESLLPWSENLPADCRKKQ